jgi:hypothetical protein
VSCPLVPRKARLCSASLPRLASASLHSALHNGCGRNFWLWLFVDKVSPPHSGCGRSFWPCLFVAATTHARAISSRRPTTRPPRRPPRPRCAPTARRPIAPPPLTCATEPPQYARRKAARTPGAKLPDRALCIRHADLRYQLYRNGHSLAPPPTGRHCCAALCMRLSFD